MLNGNKREMTKNILLNAAFIERDKLNNELPLTPIGSEIDFSLYFPNTERCIDINGTIIHHVMNAAGMGI